MRPRGLWLAAAIMALACTACGTTASVPSVAPPTPSPTPAGGEHRFRVPGLPTEVVAVLPPGWQPDGPMMTRTSEDAATFLSVSVWVVKEVYSDPCQWAGTEQSVGRSAARLASALEGQVLRHARQTTVSIGENTARMVTMSVPDDVDLASCDEGEFRSWAPARGREARAHEGPDQVDEMYVIALGKKRSVVVDASYFPDASSEELAEIHRIVASLEFGRR
jgi:hypothetical protein